MSSHETPSSLTLIQRLETAPFGRAHGCLVLGAGVGWALTAMNVGVVAAVTAALAGQWSLSAGQVMQASSLGFAGMAVGAALGGRLADVIGRRDVFVASLLVNGLASLATASADTVQVMLVLRFVIGLGLGAALPVASTLVSEMSPERIRGRVVVVLESFWAVGWLLYALVGRFVVQPYADGWRWALLAGVVPVLLAVAVRWGIPESARFLVGKGRLDEAERVIRRFEPAAATRPGLLVPQRPAGPTATARTIRSPRRTIALWLVWFSINFAYYGVFTWRTSILPPGPGQDFVRSFTYTMIMVLAQFPGYAVAAWLIEKWGRRTTLATFLGGAAISAVGFTVASTPTQLGGGVAALSFFTLGAWGVLYAVGPELYSTQVRGTATGLAAAFGRIGSMIAPVSVPLMLNAGGTPLAFGVFGIAFVIGCLAAGRLPETQGQQL